MEQKNLKQVMAIDVAMENLDLCFGQFTSSLNVVIRDRSRVKNTKEGFQSMLNRMKKFVDPSLGVLFVMEATGVYHERLAHFLFNKGCEVCIVLPSKMSNFMKTLDVKTITDKTSAEAIARFAFSRNLTRWQPADPDYSSMKQLTRERDQIIKERVVIKNQLHSEKEQAFPSQNSIKRLNERLKLLESQEKQVTRELLVIVNGNPVIKDLVRRLTTIPGIGFLTAAIILAETNGFEFIRNKKQLVSYAGLDVIVKESGKSIKGKATISKRGNRYLRKSLHLPSLTAIRKNEEHKGLFVRIVEKGGIKMRGVVAVQRKLLELSYTLVKKEEDFNPDYWKGHQTIPVKSVGGEH